MENHNNPLKQYFRKPGIWVKLPSQGKFYQTRPAELNDMGEIPIYPMTAKDELLAKNADALLNGSAIIQLVKSCAPTIADPENMPSIDLDAVLVAVKRCTYGEFMDVSTTCDCEEATKNDVRIDVNQLIAGIKVIEDMEPIEHESGIKIYTRPITVKNILDLNWVQYEQVRQIQMAERQDLEEKARTEILTTSYEKLTNQSLKVVAGAIETLLLPDGTTVTEPKWIEEWVRDLSRPEYSKLEKAIMDTNSKGIDKELRIQCQKCNKVYTSQLDLNPTTFFA
jgi:hypothetical protein